MLQSAQTVKAKNPSTGDVLEGSFALATANDIERAMQSADRAWRDLRRISSLTRARFLGEVASAIERNAEDLLRRCSLETGLPLEARLRGELQRTCTVLRMFGAGILSGEVQDLRVTGALPDRSPRPRSDIRRMKVGVGPVVVIEASNFPLAFGVVGGDTASAWAAGCSVVAKGHPYHPGTSQLIADAISSAVGKAGMPEGIFALLHGGAEQTIELVKHPLTRGVGFTGSRQVGRALFLAAASRPRPLDELSLEMGSLNPIFLLPGALSERNPQIAAGLADAVLIGGGQFCTKPGHVYIPADAADEFCSLLLNRMKTAPPAVLLSSAIAENYRKRVLELGGPSEDQSQLGAAVTPSALVVSYDEFISKPEYLEEIFGPVTVVIRTPVGKFVSAAEAYQGELTGTIHIGPGDQDLMNGIFSALETRVGRVIFNGYPPGVELCDAIYHGGPWPAALGRSTVVGPSSFERWQRPICYQDVPAELLPPELKPGNPCKLPIRES